MRINLKFQNLGIGPVKLAVYSDASLGSLHDGGTEGGHVVFLVGENRKFSPLD